MAIEGGDGRLISAQTTALWSAGGGLRVLSRLRPSPGRAPGAVRGRHTPIDGTCGTSLPPLYTQAKLIGNRYRHVSKTYPLITPRSSIVPEHSTIARSTRCAPSFRNMASASSHELLELDKNNRYIPE